MISFQKVCCSLQLPTCTCKTRTLSKGPGKGFISPANLVIVLQKAYYKAFQFTDTETKQKQINTNRISWLLCVASFYLKLCYGSRLPKKIFQRGQDCKRATSLFQRVQTNDKNSQMARIACKLKMVEMISISLGYGVGWL